MKQEMKIWKRRTGYDFKAFPDWFNGMLSLTLIVFFALLFVAIHLNNYVNAIYDIYVLLLTTITMVCGKKARDYAYQVQNNGRKYDWEEVKKQGHDGTYKLSKDKPMED